VKSFSYSFSSESLNTENDSETDPACIHQQLTQLITCLEKGREASNKHLTELLTAERTDQKKNSVQIGDVQNCEDASSEMENDDAQVNNKLDSPTLPVAKKQKT